MELVKAAREHLKHAMGLESIVRRSGKIGKPIAVQHPRGSINHWFVPVVVGERLAGFFLFDSRLRMERYSSFLRGRDEILAAPELGSWTDVMRISARGVAAGPDFEALGEPYLTYDGSVDRLVWALPVRSETDTSLVYIAGDFTYLAPKKPETTG